MFEATDHKRGGGDEGGRSERHALVDALDGTNEPHHTNLLGPQVCDGRDVPVHKLSISKLVKHECTAVEPSLTHAT